MSKRLNYLAEVRPEAATAYFTFLKESGRHLDDKTRFLISVVTKVCSGTAAGLKQYIPHAMRAGATGNEIIDAILMSFPAAGLPKVLDALDVVRGLGMADFLPENLKKLPQWYEIGPLKEFPEGELIEKSVMGFGLLIYNNGKDLKVYDRRCPHAGNKLPCKKSEAGTLTCPSHQWVFDLASGDCLEKGSRGIHTLPFQIEGDIVKARLLIFAQE